VGIDSGPRIEEVEREMTYEEKRQTLINYMKVKMQEADWHGVSDCANDLRVLEAAHNAKLEARAAEMGKMK
jgi:phosphoserine phosphatase